MERRESEQEGTKFLLFLIFNKLRQCLTSINAHLSEANYFSMSDKDKILYISPQCPPSS